MRMRFGWVKTGWYGAALAAALAGGVRAQEVDSFAPEGTVKQVRQVTAHFTTDMVPFGDLRLPDPFTVDCAEPGKGRWVDSSNWAYDFERDLPAGVICHFTLPATAKDLAGKPLVGKHTFTFSTGGPAVVEELPGEGWRIDERQIFLFSLDAPATAASIRAHAWCQADGIGEKIGVRLIEGQERAALLEQRKDLIDSWFERFMRARGRDITRRRGQDLPVVALQCQRTLPADAAISVVWGAGISTPGGVATTEDQPLAYRVRPEFTARLSCTRVNPRANCVPFLPVQLWFSARIPRATAERITLATPDGKLVHATLEGDEGENGKDSFVQGLTFPGPFPVNAALPLAMPADVRDESGRTLTNRAALPAQVRTDDNPPLIKFPARFGIVEAHGDRLLPVTVRNVEHDLPTAVHAGAAGRTAPGRVLRTADQDDEAIIAWLRRLSPHYGWQPTQQWGADLRTPVLGKETAERIALPLAAGKQESEVIGIPLKRPGFYVVELASPILGGALNDDAHTAYVNAAALVTNLAAHFKHGAESSLVWVTTLDRGLPVAGAEVAVRTCAGVPLWHGRTDAQGVARINQPLTGKCDFNEAYFVSARSGGDMTFTLSDWQGGIEAWRFNVNTESRGADRVLATTVFDRTLLRAGETVHMKHFLRTHDMRGLALPGVAAQDEKNPQPGRAARPDKITLVHEGTDDTVDVPVHWSANATAESTWQIPEDAKLGTYNVMIAGRPAGSFRVEQFRVPLMRGSIQGPKAPPIAPQAVPLDLQLAYLSGGGASLAQVKLSTVVEAKTVYFGDYDGFQFANGDVVEGIEKASPDGDEPAPDEGNGGAGRAAVRTRNVTLDKAGGARVVIDGVGPVAGPRALSAEMSYKDPDGETLTVSKKVDLWPAAVIVGLKPDAWMATRDSVKFQAMVVDLNGKPLPDTQVDVDMFARDVYSHRRRLLGGFYAYENSSEIKKLAPACSGRTDAHGLLFCDVHAPVDGQLILRARSSDAAGRVAYTHADIWVAGNADWWFEHSDNDRIDLLPSKKRYEPGEQATFQVRSPFREATVLVTVEREGVMESYVRHISGRDPSVTIPMKANYAPNVYVSALVVRGRVASVQPTALVDLGKPAYKMGLARVRVGWAANELKVQVKAPQAVYKVRQKVPVSIHAARANGQPLPAGTEVVVAAVDEGLLELMPNTSWDLLETMMAERGLQVETSTAQMQVIGKRHFGRKAVAAGGGGGRSAGRELFETLLFWKARVVLDAHGNAHVTIPLNDSLTSFRIVAVASGGASLFGTGAAVVRTSQDLMMLAGLPPLVREGDHVRAAWTLRNASEHALTAQVTASVGADGGKAVALPAQSVNLAAGASREVAWEYTVPWNVSALAWEASARAGDVSDTIRTSQVVKPAVPVHTLQATLMQLDGAKSVPVQMPADAIAGRGGIVTRLSARLAEDMPGVEKYMRDYPYTCFEQRTSRAVALRDEKMWDANMNDLPSFLDGDGLVKYFTSMDHGSDGLTAYVISIADASGRTIPPEDLGRMQEALAGFVRGKIVRGSPLNTADLAVRKVAALEALSIGGLVKQDMLESFTVAPNLWPTEAVIDWYLVLKRTPDLPGRDQKLAQTESILRSRLNLQGTTMGFSTERTDFWWWLMMSGDVNANRFLLAMLDNPAWKRDMGRLARGAIGRQLHGHWSTTVGNAWGVAAMDKFSEAFEKEEVDGSTSVTLDGKTQSVAWADDKPKGDTVLRMPWPAGPGTLALAHAGSGKPWAVVQSNAAIPLKAPLSSGYKITRTVTPLERKTAGVWSRGDIYRVRLDLEAQADMTWVVVDDPIPAGAAVLGTGLGRDSHLATQGEQAEGWAWPAYQERTFEGFRSYYEMVPKGKWSVEYTVRLNNAGDFSLPPTRVEAMYNPEMFGATPNAPMTIVP